MENGQITVTITGKNFGELAKGLLSAHAALTTNGGSVGIGATPIAATTRGRPRKTEAKEVIEDEIIEDEIEASDTEEDTFEDESEEEQDEAPKGILPSEITAAFKRYAAKGPAFKEKAKLILKKYKVTHVDDLKNSDYPAIMKALS